MAASEGILRAETSPAAPGTPSRSGIGLLAWVAVQDSQYGYMKNNNYVSGLW